MFLSVGQTLTMALDEDGFLWDQAGNIGCISTGDGSVSFVAPEIFAKSCLLPGKWTSDATDNAAILPPSGYGAAGCANTTSDAYQMYCFSGSPPIPSCTGVLLQVTLSIFS